MKRVDPSIYDKNYYLEHSYGFERMLERVKLYLDIKPGMRVLDLGCGIGDLAFYMAEQGAEVVGVGALIEKTFEEGREHLEGMGIHVESLARIQSMTEEGITFYRP